MKSAAGNARTFQNIRLFNDLTVLDNVRIALHKDVQYPLLSAVFRIPSFFKGEAEMEKKADEFLKIFHLYDKRYEKASSLPYGDQRRLEIARRWRLILGC